MKLSNPAHPVEIILEYFLDSPDHVVSSGKHEYIKALIINKSNINEQHAQVLANVFQTSVLFWLNLQKQYDICLEKPLKDMSINCDTYIKALISVSKTKQPAHFPTESGESLYLLTEQAYKYLLSKCTEDEAWDLGWLGQSEPHAISKSMPEKLKKLIQKHNNTY